MKDKRNFPHFSLKEIKKCFLLDLYRSVYFILISTLIRFSRIEKNVHFSFLHTKRNNHCLLSIIFFSFNNKDRNNKNEQIKDSLLQN